MRSVSVAATSAPVRVPKERGPAALLPAWVARLGGFAALACLGISQWQRMVEGLPAARPFVWVLLAVLAAGCVLLCEEVPERARLRHDRDRALGPARGLPRGGLGSRAAAAASAGRARLRPGQRLAGAEHR